MYGVPRRGAAVLAATLDVRVAQVLAWCNHVRAELDLSPLADLRTGARGNPWFCPVCRTVGRGMPVNLQPEFAGRTLRVWVGQKLIRLQVTAPVEVAGWSEAFDRGEFDRYAISRDVAFAEGWT